MSNVLFLCTANAARSIIAEALANHLSQGGVRAYSSGSHPAGAIYPQTISVLQAHGVDTDGLHSKPLSQLPAGKRYDYIITLCDQAAGDGCPVPDQGAQHIHWSIPDPARVEGNSAMREAAFAEAFALIRERILAFLKQIESRPAISAD